LTLKFEKAAAIRNAMIFDIVFVFFLFKKQKSTNDKRVSCEKLSNFCAALLSNVLKNSEFLLIKNESIEVGTSSQ